ncbi:arginase family protein [Agromyces atrinae]|uniref:arginase family protein n=1 Tax=Agromyces atrinae TaxID=592376 RepID=UPI001F57BA55|nr:arginase family protein [Agromyces atrinae]MCI2956224.1 arginase family protein [Agromyces atrinae]
MQIGIVSAPTNLGLRPPAPGTVPGTSKAPEALREVGLHSMLASRGAREFGVVLPGRYEPDVLPNDVLRNEAAILRHTRALAERVDLVLDAGHAPLVLGGDCSLLVGAALALRRHGRFGLVYLDGHGDFRHAGNDPEPTTLGGEALAAVTGHHDPVISDVDGLAPLVAPADAVQVGCRDDDVFLDEMRREIAAVVPASDVISGGAATVAERITAIVDREELDGYWLHLDIDILDARWMPAVDSPDPGGLSPDQLVELLALLAPRAIGADVTIFDPDLDPDGEHARTVARVIAEGFARLGAER